MRYLAFWMLPLLSAGMWLGMLLAMLIKWVTDGSPHYSSMAPGQHIAYISDIGAEFLKPLFIAGSCVTVVTLDASIIAERWLRHRGYLVRNSSKGEKILSGFAILFAILGAAGLILLSVFDTVQYKKAHDIFLLVFIGGYIISAIFSCAEYQRLGIKERQHRVLRISFWVKLSFIIVEFALAICFASLTFTHHQEEAAVFEWVVALIFTFWTLSFSIDLLPVVRRGRHSGKGPALEMNEV